MEDRKPASKVKITILKRLHHQDLIDEYLLEEKRDAYTPCYRFTDGQEFIIDSLDMPEGFCPWAWADIHREIISVMLNADFPASKDPGCIIASCTDGLRPVIFKVERVE